MRKKPTTKARERTDRELAKMERHLSAIYNRAAKEIKERWAEYLAEIEPELAAARKEYAAAKAGGDEVATRAAGRKLGQMEREKVMHDNHYEAMVSQTAAQLANINETAIAYMNGQLPPVYALNYNAIGSEIGGAVKGYSFELIDQQTVKRLSTDSAVRLLPKISQTTLAAIKKELDKGNDIRWNTRKINSEILQGVIRGDSMDKVADRLQRVSTMNKNSAIRNARTMVTSAENGGRLDGMRQAEADGLILDKKWIATNDNKTRHWHSDLDGVTVPVDEPFVNDYGDIMFPGDPDADAANVYNCRCTMGYKVVGFRGGNG